MRLKSFHGSNMTEAMRNVRDALGDDAIIVATRDDEMGGVRVTAAIEEVEPASDAPASRGAAYSAPEPPEGVDVIEHIAQVLTRHQVPNHIAERLVATATQFANDDPVVALGAAFDAHFKFLPIIDDKPGKPLIMIGPPGAGKTLCTAKFATKATLARKPVTIVSTDFERAGGLEQLAAFTRLLKVNLVEIEDAPALHELVSMQQGSAVFIDTAGRNPFILEECKQLLELVTAAGGNGVLVLPAGMDASEAADMAQIFQKVGARRLILTRLDMARRYGSVLGTAYEAKLPLANFSASSSATEPPAPLNPVALARLVLYGPQHRQNDADEESAKKAGR